MTLGELLKIVNYDWIGLYCDGDFISNCKKSDTDGYDHVAKKASTMMYNDYIVECIYSGRMVDMDGHETPKLSIDLISPKKANLINDLKSCKEFINEHPHPYNLVDAIDKAIDIVKKEFISLP